MPSNFWFSNFLECKETLQKYIYGQFIVEGYWIIASLSAGVDFDFFFEGELYEFRLTFEFLLLIIPSKDMYQSWRLITSPYSWARLHLQCKRIQLISPRVIWISLQHSFKKLQLDPYSTKVARTPNFKLK